MSNKLFSKNNSLVLYKTNNEFFIRAIVRIFSFGESILTIALINIHYENNECLCLTNK